MAREVPKMPFLWKALPSYFHWRRQWQPTPHPWKIPWMEEPGRLQSRGSWRVIQDWEASLSLFTFMHWRRKWQPTPVFLPGESQGLGSLAGYNPWDLEELDTTEKLTIYAKFHSLHLIFIPLFLCFKSDLHWIKNPMREGTVPFIVWNEMVLQSFQ